MTAPDAAEHDRRPRVGEREARAANDAPPDGRVRRPGEGVAAEPPAAAHVGDLHHPSPCASPQLQLRRAEGGRDPGGPGGIAPGERIAHGVREGGPVDRGAPRQRRAARVGHAGGPGAAAPERLRRVRGVAAARRVERGDRDLAGREREHLSGRVTRGARRGGEVRAGDPGTAQHLAMGEVAQRVAGVPAPDRERVRADHHRLGPEGLPRRPWRRLGRDDGADVPLQLVRGVELERAPPGPDGDRGVVGPRRRARDRHPPPSGRERERGRGAAVHVERVPARDQANAAPAA